MQAFPKPEGELFPGVIASLLALIGIVFGGRVTERIPAPAEGAAVERAPSSASGITTRWLAWFFAAAAVGHGVAAVATLLLRRITFDTGLFVVRMSNVNQLLLRGGVAFVLMLLVSPAARARTRAFMRDRGFFVIVLLAAFWLSLGPAPQSLGRPVEIAGPYQLLFDYVPGFDGVRVPARFAMIVAFALAVLAGYGAAALSRAPFGHDRPGRCMCGRVSRRRSCTVHPQRRDTTARLQRTRGACVPSCPCASGVPRTCKTAA